MAAIAVGAVWWSSLLAIGAVGWGEADWAGQAVIGLLIVGSATLTFLVASRWKNLSLVADSGTVRFGVRELPRTDLACISMGPTARTAAQFWLGVVTMAVTQDLSRKVRFMARDGRALLEITDLYGATQLATLAAFLGVPLSGGPPSR